VGLLDWLRGRVRPLEDPTLAERCRWQAANGLPTGAEWDDRRWPTADQLTDLADELEAMAEGSRVGSPPRLEE
jgi:hypothetical protein